jgi:hypothetical protein
MRPVRVARTEAPNFSIGEESLHRWLTPGKAKTKRITRDAA